jgi:ribonuclease P protein component
MRTEEGEMQNEDEQLPPVAGLLDSSFIIQPSSFPFPRSHRLSGKLLFSAVYDAKVKTSKGPLAAYSLPNRLGHCRLGISMSRRVGTAPQRNRIKRLLRESFRLHPRDLAVGYDLVIVVRPHVPMPLGEYRKLFANLLNGSHQSWQRRATC